LPHQKNRKKGLQDRQQTPSEGEKNIGGITMKTNTILRSILTSSVLGALILTGGCQPSGVVLSEEASPHCPLCKTVTKTGPIKGTKRTTEMHCPYCKTEYIDESIGELEDVRTTHSCSHCGINVKACQHCADVLK
jgi:hypothetical protein